MPCNTFIFQDWANNSKIKDPTGADGSTGEGPMDETNSATSFFTYLVDVKRPGEGVRDHNPKKFGRGHPLNDLVVKIKFQVKERILFGGNYHGLGLGSVSREMVV